MLIRRISILCVFALLCVSIAGGADRDVNPIYRPAPFADGETVCNVGDSITHGGKFSSFLMLFYATRYPERQIRFVNAGIGGATADSTLKRFEWDIASCKPDVVSVMLGMNDQGRRLYKPETVGPWVEENRKVRVAKYKANMSELTARFENDLKARVILLTPSPYDQTAQVERENDYAEDDPLDQFAHWLHALAMRRGYTLVPFHGPMTAINLREQVSDPAFTLCGGDRIHPGDLGHLVMAYQFLTAQGVSPFVYDIEMNAKGSVVRAENATITDAKASNGGLEFRVNAQALPFPLKAEWMRILDLVPFEKALDQQRLVVTGLSSGDHELLIDGKPVGVYSSENLKAGINLAFNEKTPSNEQARAVLDLAMGWYGEYKKIRDLAWARSRIERKGIDCTDTAALTAYVQKVLDNPKERKSNQRRFKNYLDTRGELPTYEKNVADIAAKIREAAQPKAHVYSIRPATDTK